MKIGLIVGLLIAQSAFANEGAITQVVVDKTLSIEELFKKTFHEAYLSTNLAMSFSCREAVTGRAPQLVHVSNLSVNYGKMFEYKATLNAYWRFECKPVSVDRKDDLFVGEFSEFSDEGCLKEDFTQSQKLADEKAAQACGNGELTRISDYSDQHLCHAVHGIRSVSLSSAIYRCEK